MTYWAAFAAKKQSFCLFFFTFLAINISLIKKLYGVQLCVLYLELQIIWPTIV